MATAPLSVVYWKDAIWADALLHLSSVCTIYVQLVVNNRGRSDKFNGRSNLHSEFVVHPRIGVNYQRMSASICRVKNANPLLIDIHFYFTLVKYFAHEESAHIHWLS